jgi:hypothetical protein
LRFLDEDGFTAFEQRVLASELSIVAGGTDDPIVRRWEGTAFRSPHTYSGPASWTIGWKGVAAASPSEAVSKAPTSKPTPARKPATSVSRPGWREQVRWRELRMGMTDLDVRRLLGPPTKVQAGYITYWIYGGSSILSPHVSFKDERVTGWEEPTF